MDLHLELGPGPKRAQLERRLRDGVRAGRLRPGVRLPPSRQLARDLGVSRGVVVEAYGQLVAEGWLSARPGAGTVVAAAAPDAGAGACSPPQAPPPIALDLRTGRPDLSAFPRAAWHAAVGRALRTLPDAALGYGDPRGHAPLREALAAHLGRTRGVTVDPAGLVVTGGTYPGLQVVWRALARHGARRVAVEEPGWRGQRRSVERAGLEAVAVPVDERGIVVSALGDVDAVCVTPAHQFPTGVVLAPERRAGLVAWAARRRGVVVEDDYDAEFRFDREPVGALQGLAPDRVVHAASASKTLAPALRLGWVAAPAWLAGDVAEEKDLADRGTPLIDQAAFADLLERGEVDRHLRRMRRRYRSRRDALAGALATELPDGRVHGAAAGLHLVLELPEGAGAHGVCAACAARGVGVEAIDGALLLGYAALPEASLVRAAGVIAAIVRACGA